MPFPRVTHTYAILEISSAAFAEISLKLTQAGYSDQFHAEGTVGDQRIVIDMHGIAVTEEK